MTFKETCWFIYGFKIKRVYFGIMVKQSTGGPASVDFDWRKVFRQRKALIGFFHTHPDGVDDLSQIDHRTMRGWVTALGKPLLCGIKESGQTQMIFYHKFHSSHLGWTVPFFKLGTLLFVLRPKE